MISDKVSWNLEWFGFYLRFNMNENANTLATNFAQLDQLVWSVRAALERLTKTLRTIQRSTVAGTRCMQQRSNVHNVNG